MVFCICVAGSVFCWHSINIMFLYVDKSNIQINIWLLFCTKYLYQEFIAEISDTIQTIAWQISENILWKFSGFLSLPIIGINRKRILKVSKLLHILTSFLFPKYPAFTFQIGRPDTVDNYITMTGTKLTSVAFITGFWPHALFSR